LLLGLFERLGRNADNSSLPGGNGLYLG
jgi:hypothetical protein